MMTVTLDGNTLAYILDTAFIETIVAHIPNYVGDATPEIDATHWNRKVFRITYMLRATNALKYALDLILLAHAVKTLVDTDYSIDSSVWMISLEAEWDGLADSTNPWKVTIELISEV